MRLFCFFAVLLLVSSALALAEPAGGKANVRAIAHDDKETTDAVASGCKLLKKGRAISAVECPQEAAASLGLREDVELFAVDSGANSQIGADKVQALGNIGSGRRIVVLDTGYNYKHPELISSYLGGWDFYNDDNNPWDDNGHGTHVAGLITADGTKSLAKGVAPGAGIIAGKVLGASGSGYLTDIVEAMYWAVNGQDGIYGTPDDFKADAISISIGTSKTYTGFCDDSYPEFRDAIKYAMDRGVLVVVAAGNSAAGVSSPGCVSLSTTVGAVDSADRIAYFSGRGSAVDITAPGVSLYSTWLGKNYKRLSGTSMATPVVSGTVALIKAAHPDYTPSQVQSALFGTAKDLGASGWDSIFGWGRVNAPAAVSYVS